MRSMPTGPADRWQKLTELRLSASASLVPLRAMMYLELAADSGSKPAHFVVEDGVNSYWGKWPGNPHGDQSLAHEWIVSQLGKWLGAPVAEPALLAVDSALVQGVTPNGIALPGGIYFGSRFQNGSESTKVEWVDRDGNADRFAPLLALWEWCLGEDSQYLYNAEEDLQVWSIDHGLWFATHDKPWSAQRMTAWTGIDWEWPEGQQFGISQDSLLHAADRVGAVVEADLIGILAGVPVSWSVTDETLAAIGEFLLTRAPTVEESLRRRAHSAGMGR